MIASLCWFPALVSADTIWITAGGNKELTILAEPVAEWTEGIPAHSETVQASSGSLPSRRTPKILDQLGITPDMFPLLIGGIILIMLILLFIAALLVRRNKRRSPGDFSSILPA